MKWIKVKIDYFSDELNQTKENLINILSEIGIKQIEVSDFFTDNSLDYNVNFKKESDVWSITGYIIDNRFANLKLNISYEKLYILQNVLMKIGRMNGKNISIQ